MARKTATTEPKTTTVEEVVAPLEVENVKPEVVDVKEAKAEPIKHIIIAKDSTLFRKAATLDIKHVVGKMPIGTAFEIVRETSSKIYGDFYQLNNGYYITKNGNYSIS